MTTRVEGIFKPLRDGILVRNMDFGERKTASGLIVLSDDGKTGGIHPRWGEVIAVGNGEANYKGDVIPIMEISEGDIVYFPEHAGTVIEDDEGNKFLLVNSKNILAIKENE